MDNKKDLKFFLRHFSHKYIFKTDQNTNIPLSFREEMNRHARKFLFFYILIIIVAWLPYIQSDQLLYPQLTIFIYLRWGLSVLGLIVFILQFFPGPQKYARFLMFIIGMYLMNATAFITAMTGADPSYVGGFIFILMIIFMVPLLLVESLILLVTPLTVFMVTLLIRGVSFDDPRLIYALKDLSSTAAVILAFIIILNKNRYRTYLKSRELEKEKTRLALKNKNMDQELSMARVIQENLIPDKTPSPQIATLYKPMELVGGDFYDFISFRDKDKVGIFLSDVSGHGVPAAFVTSMLKSLLLQAGDIRTNPAHTMQYLNEMLMEHTGNHFITAIYGIYDFNSREFNYSNAGHNPPLLIHQNKLIELHYDKQSMPLAILNNLEMKNANKEYMNHSIRLKNNSRLIMYTDGLSDAISKGNDRIDFYEEMKQYLESSTSTNNHKAVDELYWHLVAFHGSEDFEDDICIICIDIL